MRKNFGFTLIELLAVIILISLLSLIIVPSVLNLVKKNENKLDSATLELIYSATEIYLDSNQTIYNKITGKTYCPTIKDLIDNELLEKNIINVKTGKKYDEYKDWFIKSTYDGHKYNYSIVDVCP